MRYASYPCGDDLCDLAHAQLVGSPTTGTHKGQLSGLSGWVITKDYLFESYGDRSEIGVSGPSTTPYSPSEIQSRGVRFRMGDDDSHIYYEGYWIEGDDFDEGSTDPLYGFGMGNAGCTWLQVWDNGWKSYL